MGLGRRAFLQQVSLALAALGVGEMTALGWAGRYQSALAQPTQRKLALLIGIDQYTNQVIDPALAQDVGLKGAITDVELQRELLIYRFGFQPEDIVTLTNGVATRQRILEAIEGHLVQQAEAGDVIVLHFSGYGSRIRLSDQPETLRRSLVPIDGVLPSEERPEVQDLLEAELRRALRSLKTRQLTTILDAGHRDLGQIHWGMLKVRSRPTTPMGIATAFLETPPPDEQGVDWPGLLLRAASPDRLALEGEWGGFYAGAFTYALTQTLWETMPATSLQVVFNRTTERVQRWTGPDQHPELTGKRRAELTKPPYYAALLRTATDGLITGVNPDSGTVSLWMGGMTPHAIAYLQPNSR
ncbi:MAG TPA: caspase family protein, partial [Trichocoleus sp.]